MTVTQFSDDFEAGVGAWSPNSSNRFVNATVVHAGAQSMRAQPTGTSVGWQYRAEPLQPGHTYRLLSYLRVPSTVVPTVHIALVWDFGGGSSIVSPAVTVKDAWVATELVAVAPASANPADSYIQCIRFGTGGSTADDVYVDDVLLQDITPGPLHPVSQYSSFH